MANADDNLNEGMLQMTQSTRGGLRLPADLARSAAMYFTTTLNLASVEEVMGLGQDAVLESILLAAGDEDELPTPFRTCVRGWVAALFSGAPNNNATVNVQGGMVAQDLDVAPEFVAATTGGQEMTKLDKDMAAMKLSKDGGWSS